MITWWQSLLISIAPAVITGFLSWLLAKGNSKKELAKLKEEIKTKSINEQKTYISRIKFDKEFAIYQDLSEKFITMVMDVGNLFPEGLYYEPLDEKQKIEYRKEIYNMAEKSFQEANRTINKYAIFMPEEWYDKFIEIKKLCFLQIRYFAEYRFIHVSEVISEPITKCFSRTSEITDKVSKLIKELRKYLEELDVKENK